MSTATIPIGDREPHQIAAGDNVSWTKAWAAYSATQWTLNYVIRTKKNTFAFQGVASGDVFQVTLTTAQTSKWAPGLYAIGAYLQSSDGSQQVQIRPSFPTLLVTPNLASNPNGVDATSWAAKMLGIIEETIAAIAGRRVAAASVNGQSYSLANISELFQLREKFASEVRREQAAAKLNAGLGAGNKIGIRFKPINVSGPPPYYRVPWQ